MTIRAKALTGLLFVFFLVIGSGGLTLYVQRQDVALVAEGARTTRVLQLQAELEATLAALRSDRRLYLLTGTEELQHAFRRNEQEALQTLAVLDADVRDASQRDALARITTQFDVWRQSPVTPVAAPSQSVVLEVIRASEAAFQPLASSLASFERRQREISIDAQRRIEQYRQNAQAVILLITMTVLAIVLWSISSVTRTVLRPLRTLTDAAASITQGSGTDIQPVQRSDEVGLLTNALSKMIVTVAEREEELRKRHREIETTLETVPAAFLLVDAAGHVLLQNRAATELIGAAPVGSSAMDRYRQELTLHSRDGRPIPHDQWPLARALRGDVIAGADLEMRRGDRGVPMLVAAAPIRNAAGAIDGAVIAFQDVSALRAVDRMKDEFVSTVSHELRTPLTSIRGSLQLVLDDPECIVDEDHRQLLNVALNNCERLTRIINDILDVSKIEAGRMALQTTPANVAEIVAAAIQVVEPMARRVPVHLKADLEDDLPAIVVDADRIVQALVNLLSNAVKFAPAASEVRIEVRLQGHEIAIAIEDEGIGISDEDLGRLFQKFQQVDGSASRRKGGTGLGLVISKSLIEQHGGRIDVRSEVGKGTRFIIMLPAGSMAPPVMAMPVERPATRGGIVLVIDDDDEFRLVIRRHLERAGYRVVEAREGAAGLHVARETRPDVITLDLMMPGMNGWELLSRLSVDPELNSIPVVIISAVADEAGPLANEVSVLAKPITQDRLLKEVGDAIMTPGATVLIAEDDPDLRRVFTESLTRRGHSVIIAADGAEALAEMERTRIDLLVVDLKMPNVDGLTLIQRVRESAAGRELPIVVVSGGDGAGAFRAMKLGADAYLPKPVDAGELAERIEALVARAAPI